MSDEKCFLQGRSSQYLIQFWIRIVTLSLALLATLFIIITCIKSKETENFLIKLLIAQCTAESIILITSLIVNYQSACWENICLIIGYIRYCFWLSSLSCSFLMIYSNYQYIQDTQFKLKIYNKSIIKKIIFAFIFPFIWLAIPLYFKEFGPTGWELYKNEEEKFIVFCGFSQKDSDLLQDLLHYLFWSIPIILLLSVSFYISRKSKQSLIHNSLDENECLIPKQFQIGVQIYPLIYLITWSLEIILRFIEKIPIIQKNITTNIFLYLPYSVFLLGFHLHICIAQIMSFLALSQIYLKSGCPLFEFN